MLAKLLVRNFAIIDATEIHFSDGFTTITGETGAGKSILLGALSLILGQRADKSTILNPEKKSIIEGVFRIEKDNFSFFFENHDLDFETETIIRRELKADGKSRAFINDTPVTLDILKEFSSRVIDLHQQHESLSLSSKGFQRNVIDLYAGISEQVQQYHQQFKEYVAAQQELAIKREKEIQNRQEQDFLTFQMNELEEAQIKTGELEELEEQLRSVQHYEDIQEGLEAVHQLFHNDEAGAIAALRKILSEIHKISSVNKKFIPLGERLNSAFIEIDDIQQEIAHFNHEEEIDEVAVEQMESRVNLLNRLLQKHQVITDEELLEKQHQLSEQLSSFESLNNEIKQLEKRTAELLNKLRKEADIISKHRKKMKPELESELQSLLVEVGMPKSVFELSLKQEENIQPYGKDSIEFLFSANTGSAPKPLKQVASGGELSRLMLAIKSLIADKTVLPTMIFDEIDTGISGEVAMKVGAMLQKLSHRHQIISITHLPQIAAKGNRQLKVFKEEREHGTRSQVKELSTDERVQELAEMLSGANPSASALKAAKELVVN